MTSRINRRKSANADVETIWTWIATKNITAAEELLDRFETILEMLVRNPHAGRPRPDLGHNLRSFAVESYIIFYISHSGGIDVVRVMHGRQDISPADMK
jgi:toxin ParE1/3/4